MSNGTLTPQNVESGWATRWTKQTVDLWRRSPLALASVIVISSLANMWIPQPLGADMLVDIPLFGCLFLLIRLLDHHGTFAWEPFRAMASDAWKDLWKLTKFTFIWMFFLSILVVLIAVTAKSFMSSIGSSSGMNGALHRALSQSPSFLQNSFWQGLGMISNASNPFAGPILFLTLYLGANTVYYLHIAYLGCLKNLSVMISFFVTAMTGPTVIKMIAAAMLSLIGNDAALLLTSLLMSALCLWVVTFGYLWSREMFEGTKENQPAKAKAVLLHAIGHA